ncbi:MAG: hypothetical protein QG622_1287 [Actinomycetota bacterium]|nr:hypothetical protein [Actinomycetota bacterium]
MISAFLAFVLGVLWNRILHLLVNCRARRFWRSLISNRVSIVLGRFRDLPGFEASGVVGAGDNLALRDLADYFGRIGFTRYTVYYNDQFGGTEPSTTSPLHGNLVLLGGPDANSVTREVLSRLDLGFEFLEVSRSTLDRLRRPEAPRPPRRGGPWSRTVARPGSAAGWRVPVFRDRVDGRIYGPVLHGDDIRTDCGVVIRCRNPFNPAKEAIIICGSYGYGTWGAVRYLQSPEFLRKMPRRRRGSRAMECLLSVDIAGERPAGMTPLIIRPLEHHQATERVQVPRVIE